VPTDPGRSKAEGTRLHPAERPIFFTDAVVAIAMTLLILPLMESVSDAGEDTGAGQWLAENWTQLVSFALSFVLVGVFWRSHARLFEHVEAITDRMMMLNFTWMFTIVWLPVVTSLSGALPTFDPATGQDDKVLIALYVGTLAANSLLLYLLEVTVRHHPQTWNPGDPPTRAGEAVALSMLILFTLAGVLALAVPRFNLSALLLLALTGPLQVLIVKRMKPLT
jgi:uncharacterized membrane protein